MISTEFYFDDVTNISHSISYRLKELSSKVLDSLCLKNT